MTGANSLAGPSGRAIIAALKQARVEFVAAVPDIVTSAGLLWPLSRDPAFRLVRLCKEDEGVSICAGLAFADRRAVLLMQQTGFLDSLNSIRAIAVEYADRNIRANCVCPGLVATSLAQNSQRLHGPAGTRGEPPFGRVRRPLERPADPAEIAAVVAFLCSDGSSFMTGAAVPVDGGYTAV